MAGVVVISPHLDDAVLSCGQFVAAHPDTIVVTVFAGTPRASIHLTPYDKGCGFPSSAVAMRSRRVEDQEACARLGAVPVHLGWLDGQYRTGPVDVGVVAASLRRAVADTGLDDPAVFAPLGVNHDDHNVVCDAALAAGFRDLWLYEELPARVLYPEQVQARLMALWKRRVELDFTTRPAGPLAAKQEAMRCYQSQTHQYGSLDNEHTWLVPERYWRVIR